MPDAELRDWIEKRQGRQMVRPLVLACCVAAALGCQPSADAGGPFVPAIKDSIAGRTAAAVDRTGSSIGVPQESRFVGDSMVVVLDRHPPHLRLFAFTGDSLWAGVRSGGGPEELLKPQAMAARGTKITVAQLGRLSEWEVRKDSLVFLRSLALSPEVFPLGLDYDCDGKLLLYARDDRSYTAPPDSAERFPRLDFLHQVEIAADSIRLRPLWGVERVPGLVPVLGHRARMLGRLDSSIVLLHRTNYLSAGEIIRFDCEIERSWSISENALARGDSIPVLAQRRSPPQWTSGVGLLPGNRLVYAMERYFLDHSAGRPVAHTKTEIFFFVDDTFRGSQFLEGQWAIMDSDAEQGVLMTNAEPSPHFVILPTEWFRYGTEHR